MNSNNSPYSHFDDENDIVPQTDANYQLIDKNTDPKFPGIGNTNPPPSVPVTSSVPVTPAANPFGYTNSPPKPNVPYQPPTATQPTHLSTLDEPIMETLKRDLLAIWRKIMVVLIPHGRKDILRDWDLWGPLLLCLLLAVTLSMNSSKDSAYAFTLVFVIVWVGSAIVTVNSTLLGGNMSFLQSVCTLGYCIFPLNIASIISLFFSNVLVRAIVCGISLFWCVTAAVQFLGNVNLEKRRILAVYPIFLFYFIMTWLILIS